MTKVGANLERTACQKARHSYFPIPGWILL